MSAKIKTQIKSYQDAKEFLGSKKSRKVAHNTELVIDTLELGHEVITVKYHGNSIVNLFPNGTISLNSCGWHTSTTKERLNWFLPWGMNVYQENWTWYFVKWEYNDNVGRVTLGTWKFEDGMTIKNGEIYNAERVE